MATQKDLLRTAILSGAVQATRVKANDFVDVSVAGDNYGSGEQTFISPVDGYFSISVSDAEGSNRQYMGVKVHADGVEQSATVNDSGLSYACHVPVKKGSSVKIASRGSSKVWWAHFVKVIGGGHKRYLPTLSCNRFGGALWLRLKTASETLPRLVAGSRSRLSVASSSRASHLHLAREIASTCRQQTVFASFGLRVPVSTLRFADPVAHNLSRQTVLQAGRKLVFLVPVDKSSTMRLGVRSSEGRSTSFLLSVASNNARMEVAA